MTRQQQLKEIGEMIPENFMSQFIIPFHHHFYDNNASIFAKIDIFDKIEESGWEIVNKNNTKQIGAFNIKKYIYDNMIPKLDNKNAHLSKNKTVFLRRRIDKQAKISKFSFSITELDLWIFDEHIGFFVLKVSMNDTKYSINDLSEFNRQMREFKFLECSENNDVLTLKKAANFTEPNDMLECILKYTQIDNKSFLNISKDECVDSLIYSASTNAKMMTAMQTKTSNFLKDKNNNKPGESIEPLYSSELNSTKITGTSTLEEIPYYLASCSSLSPSPEWTNNEEYIHSMVDDGGFNIWKYSSGIILHDSFALFGLNKDGGPVVSNMKNSFYFIYMLNLYIHFQLRFIAYEIIDEDFDSLDISYRYKQLQKLKNQFISKEVGTKFQENEIHKSIRSALSIEEIVSEVTENLMETKEITQSHFGIYMTLLGFIVVTLLEVPIKNIIVNHFVAVIIGASILLVIWLKFKSGIKKTFRRVLAKFY